MEMAHRNRGLPNLKMDGSLHGKMLVIPEGIMLNPPNLLFPIFFASEIPKSYVIFFFQRFLQVFPIHTC